MSPAQAATKSPGLPSPAHHRPACGTVSAGVGSETLILCARCQCPQDKASTPRLIDWLKIPRVDWGCVSSDGKADGADPAPPGEPILYSTPFTSAPSPTR